MKGFKDSQKRFHPITEYKKGTRKSRDQKAKRVGVRLQIDIPPTFMTKGKFDEKKLKKFFQALSDEEKRSAIQFYGTPKKSVYEDLTATDKADLMEFEKRITDPSLDPKSEVVKRGIVPAFSVREIPTEQAVGYLKGEQRLEDFKKRIEEVIKEHTNYEQINEQLDSAEIVENPKDKKAMYRYIDTGDASSIMGVGIDDEYLEDKITHFIQTLNKELKFKYTIETFSYPDDENHIIIGQRLDPKKDEDNQILIAKGVLRRKRVG